MMLLNRINRKYQIIIAIVIIAVAATIEFLSIKNGKHEIRNIILISIDTCRADYLSCYGYPQETTPNIDAFARNATLFKNVVSPVPITLPAHCTMLTGTIPPFHGVHNNSFFKLAPSNQTLPEILKQNGFNTSAIVSAFVLDKRFGLAQGFDTYHDTFKKIKYNTFGNERNGDETTQAALDWLDKNKDNRSFLMLHYYDPHADYAPPEPFASKFADNLYAGEIAFTDHCIGRFIQKLKDLQMYNSALLIIAGDHGEMLGEHGEKEHTFFIYESAIKVPLIVKLPGQKKASTVTQPVGLVDIVPTVCSILNIDIPARVHGKDISALLHGKVPDAYERYIYSESMTPTSYGANSLMSISTEKWKFIQSKRPELYDITTDTREEHNLVEKEPHRVRILRDKLRETLERAVLKDPDSRFKLDPESIRRLQSLGYVAGKEDGEIAFDDSKDDPKDLIHIFVQYQKAVVLVANNELEKAKKVLTDLIPQRPDFPEIYSQLGSIELQQGNYDQAVLHCKKLVELSPDDPTVYISLSGALLKTGDYKQSIKYGLKAVEMVPDNIDAQINLAIAFNKEGDLDQAVNTYIKAFQLSPENAKICNSLAGIFISQGKFDQALGYYRRSIKIDPNQVMVLHNLARIQSTRPSLSSRNIDEAIILAERLCKLTNYKQPDALDTLATVYAAAEKFPQAIETAQKAIDVATSMNKTELAQEIAARLELYKQSMPYMHPPLQ
jgi:arylsulfatase A-like enzyme/Flp pilus assembly protein TadD